MPHFKLKKKNLFYLSTIKTYILATLKRRTCLNKLTVKSRVNIAIENHKNGTKPKVRKIAAENDCSSCTSSYI